MPLPRVSSQRSSSKSDPSTFGQRPKRREAPSSSTSKPGITSGAGTRPSATSARLSSNNALNYLSTKSGATHHDTATQRRSAACAYRDTGPLADGAFHFHFYQAVEFDGVLHRELLDEEVEEAVDDHRGGVGFAQAAAHR